MSKDDLEGVAVVGMSGRFPKAKNIEEYWRNLVEGVECLSFPTDEELLSHGIDPSELSRPNYVKAGCFLEDTDLFDAAFFGVSPKEAELMDPQHRIFLETAWEALERAGYDPARYEGEIGVYAGCSMSTYMLFNLNYKLSRAYSLPVVLGNDKDYLSTRISYKLDLKGPSVAVQSACSTSLVAVCLATEALLDHQCSMALAGGIATRAPQKMGYTYEQGGILSPDGHCRAFDAKAQGTIFGSGVGIVVLKRLRDAVEDGDTIHAIIKGTAINNDGAAKVGYTAPGVNGQARVIAMAQATAEVSPETIGYVEAHGTGTSLGDPIEVAALTKAFRAGTAKKNFCALGSVKTNVGHLDTAAGVAGFIKAVLALENKTIPASLNFETPNPDIDLANSPFYVNRTLSEWKANGTPRRAGVSAFGIGGTNAHVVLEEAPAAEPSQGTRPSQLLLLSAKTPTALDAATVNLAEHLRRHPEVDLGDVAYTLAVGRQAFDHRRILVADSVGDAADALGALDARRLFGRSREGGDVSLAFMFPGQGAQYAGMGRELYETEPAFREQVDLCSKVLEKHLGFDLRDLLYPDESGAADADERLKQTAVTQPALFVVEYALAELLISWGVRPKAMIGHSVGEYVAACLAGVFSLEDALGLVAARGRLMQELPAGSMLAVSLTPEQVRPHLGRDVSLAAVNAPSLSVVSGPSPAVDELRARLEAEGVECRPLHTSHAFHSEMMDPILDEFAARVRAVPLGAPRLPFVSNVTGTWITEAEATDPRYWSKHLRQAVRFADGLAEVLEGPETVLLEVGPGRTLSTFARRHPKKQSGNVVLGTIRHIGESVSDSGFLLATLGKLWLEGVDVAWAEFFRSERRRRVPLPTYPFERQRYWMALNTHTTVAAEGPEAAERSRPRKRQDPADWFYTVSWKRSVGPEAPAPRGDEAPAPCTLVFEDSLGVGSRLSERLAARGHDVIAVRIGSEFSGLGDGAYAVNPRRDEDYDALLEALGAAGKTPSRVAHLWNVTEENAADLEPRFVEDDQYLGFYSLLFLAQALGRRGEPGELAIAVVSNQLHEVTGEESVSPAKATLLGPVRVIPQEYPNIRCSSVDVSLPEGGGARAERLVDQLEAEIVADAADELVAYRGTHRWVRTLEPVPMDAASGLASRLKDEGVYLITGGLGGIGLTLAEDLARRFRAKLVLTSRSPLPPRDEWASWLESHGEQDATSEKIRKVGELERLGSEVLVFSADVADQGRMEAAVAEATERFGRIDGVVHSAGVPAGGVIQRKTPQMAGAILAPKVDGTLVLDRIFRDRPLDFFVLCSSLSAIVGGFGQVDYCAANAFLDAFAHRDAARSGRATISVDWDAWRDVGMAAEAERRSAAPRESAPSRAEEVAHPLLQRRVEEGDDRTIYTANVSIDSHWVLSDHKIVGTATLPGTSYLEIARAAFEDRTGAGAVEIREVYFLAPLTVADGEEKQVRTVLNRHADRFTFSVMSRAGAAEAWQEHATGSLAPLGDEPAPSFDLRGIEAECAARDVVITETERKSQSGFLDFGPRWDNMQRGRFGEDRGLATLELPEAFTGDVETYKLHPALMDSATGFLSIMAIESGPFLPFTYGSIKVRGSVPAKAFSYARFAKESQPGAGTLKLDVSVLDERGREIVEIRDYFLRKVDVAQRPAAAEHAGDAPAAENYSLEVASPGILESLAYRPSERRKPGPGELEIEVSAAGLNFKEVLIALGMLPIPPGAGTGFGLECSGRVVAVGEGVDGFEIGDEVMAFARPAFSPFVTTTALYTAKKPAGITMDEAATVPVAFLTAYYSLVRMGRLAPGERVLIHAATGGVGLAAVQVAQWIGAEIYATAGSEEKRDLLRSLGIRHVTDSRSLEFADEVMRHTDGEGVDVVLNSLGGEFIAKGLSVLRPYGRFLEIGKRDIYNDTPLGLRPFERSLSFLAIDIAPRDVPDLRSSWGELVRHFEEGTFRPLRHTAFAIDEVSKAFELMSRAKHVGKVVVSLEDAGALRRFAEAGRAAAGAASGPKWRAATAARSRAEHAARPGEATSSGLYRQGLSAEGLSPAEGAVAFDRLLASALPQVVVSKRDLLGLLERGVTVDAEAPSGRPSDANLYTPSHPRPDLGNAYAAPRNETEEKVAAIWQIVLGMEQVGIYDDFYELGGDSLLATQVVARMRETFQVEIAVAKMFDQPTIAGLAEFVEAARWASNDLHGPAGEAGEGWDEGRL